jgi:hypothetical protein
VAGVICVVAVWVNVPADERSAVRAVSHVDLPMVASHGPTFSGEKVGGR